MAYLDLLTEDQLPDEARKVFELAEQRYGFVPNVLRAMAHCPDLLVTFAPFWAQVYDSPTIGSRLRALAALGTAKAQSCTYCMAHMTASARRAGMTDGEILAIGDTSVEQQVFDEREAMILELADLLTRDPDGMTNEMRERFRARFDSGEIVNIVVAIGLYNLTSRFLKALDIEVEDILKGQPQIANT